MLIGSMHFREVWLVDFEFSAPLGDKPIPICLVARELTRDKTLRVWEDELKAMSKPPYAIDGDSLFIAYYASAEMSCHLALGWAMPVKVLDLFTEFRNTTNGKSPPWGNGLLGALTWFGLNGIQAAEKEGLRALALRGGPWTPEEKSSLLDYCESDVTSLAKLLEAMFPQLDMPRALLRGRYMKAAARIEENGIPIDMAALDKLRKHWADIQGKLIERVDAEYGVFDNGTFKTDRFAAWLTKEDIPWPYLESRKLDLKDDTFKDMARSYPKVAPLRELRVALSQMRLSDLAVGRDGRNRLLLSAFRSRTGRNQPSNSQFIFGPSVWLRGLIRPEPNFGLAYVDWSQQEFGIAAALSEDQLMMEAYQSGDPYLAFAKQAKAVPANATKESHRAERDLFKACVLAVQYGMGEKSLAARIGRPVPYADELLRLHHETYKKFWRWSNDALDYAMLHNKLWTTFGWTVHAVENPNPRFLRNFLMQANGAEMLRTACIFVTEADIRICAPVHDAILIEAPLPDLDKAVTTTQKLMEKASIEVLGGFSLRSDAKIVKYPERYMDERGEKMWNHVWKLLDELGQE